LEQQQLKIDLSKTAGCICPACSNNTFKEVLLIRKVSKFLIGSNTDMHMPIPVFSCTKCDTIHTGSLTPQVRDLLNVSDDTVDVEEEETQQSAKIISMFPKK